jgi:hypothetical protein
VLTRLISAIFRRITWYSWSQWGFV